MRLVRREECWYEGDGLGTIVCLKWGLRLGKRAERCSLLLSRYIRRATNRLEKEKKEE